MVTREKPNKEGAGSAVIASGAAATSTEAEAMEGRTWTGSLSTLLETVAMEEGLSTGSIRMARAGLLPLG